MEQPIVRRKERGKIIRVKRTFVAARQGIDLTIGTNPPFSDWHLLEETQNCAAHIKAVGREAYIMPVNRNCPITNTHTHHAPASFSHNPMGLLSPFQRASLTRASGWTLNSTANPCVHTHPPQSPQDKWEPQCGQVLWQPYRAVDVCVGGRGVRLPSVSSTCCLHDQTVCVFLLLGFPGCVCACVCLSLCLHVFLQIALIDQCIQDYVSP